VTFIKSILSIIWQTLTGPSDGFEAFDLRMRFDAKRFFIQLI